MKNVLVVLSLIVATYSTAQEKKGTSTVKIQTSAECTSCKERLEEKLNYTKGVKYSNLDLESKILEVKFVSKKISLENIKTIVSDLGYDADDVKANEAAYEALPACCKVGGHAH